METIQVVNILMLAACLATSQAVWIPRLPTNVIPSNYDLYLHTNFSMSQFEGKVIISIEILEDVTNITLHISDLTIIHVKLQKEKVENIPVDKFLIDVPKDFLYIYFKNLVGKGKYYLEIMFRGNMNRMFNGMFGVYFGNGRTMVSTQFKPMGARKVFPCFDEPHLKAKYDITLESTHEKNLANMNSLQDTPDPPPATNYTLFSTSPPMSTYMVGITQCDLDLKQTVVKTVGPIGDFTLTVYAPKGSTYKIDFALDMAERLAKFYVSYFDLIYPLPKLDLVPIPNYTPQGGEFWGLITLNDLLLLVDPKLSSSSNKMNVAVAIAHELAHMWFGNLVTLEWWNDLWLVKGFNSYIQHKALVSVEPSWHMLDHFLPSQLHVVLEQDGASRVSSLARQVTTTDELLAVFDKLQYMKGSAIIRMIETFMGAENFRRGASDFVKIYKFNSATSADFISCLEPYFDLKLSPKNKLPAIIRTWTNKPKYPLLRVMKTDTPRTYNITQELFPAYYFPDYMASEYHKTDERWTIPITYLTDNKEYNETLWFDEYDNYMIITLKEDETWLKLNNEQAGYYRVTYDAVTWEALTKKLKTNYNQLKISDRANLLSDAFALAEYGIVKYDVALFLGTYLILETELAPWETAAQIFHKLRVALWDTDALYYLNKYIQKVITPIYKKQSWDKPPENIYKGALRTWILTIAVSCELPDAQTHVHKHLKEWMDSYDADNKTWIEPDIDSVIFQHGMNNQSFVDWNVLWQIYLMENDETVKTVLLQSLAGIRNEGVLENFLELAWNDHFARGADYLKVLMFVSYNPVGTLIVWNHIRENWQRLVDTYSIAVAKLIPEVTKSFYTLERLRELKVFFVDYPEAAGNQFEKDALLDKIENNVIWRTNKEKPIESWLVKVLETEKV